MVLLAFIKVTFFLRIFDGFSFLVQMISSVFDDLKYFLMFFSLFMTTFAVMISILINPGDMKDYEDIGVFGYLAMAFRSSIGDNQMEGYAGSEHKTTIWVVWLLIMVVGNIIFMNFIIAVVNQSYENCMAKSIAQTYKVKIDMIVERESLMDDGDFTNTQWFPNFIVLRRKVDKSHTGQVWQGFVKEIQIS